MAMSWEEIAESRLREIRRLRAIVRVSTLDSFIIERAANLYNLSKKTFCASRSEKSDDAPLSESEIKRRAEMEIIADFIAAIGIMDYGEFIEQAETYINDKEPENEKQEKQEKQP